MKKFNENLEFCVSGSIREKVALFIDEQPATTKLKGEKYYAFEDALVDLIANCLRHPCPETIEIIECCPECGEEIHMYMSKDAKKINFCPHCGFKDVLLCSECMEKIGDCNPNDSGSYCEGRPHLSKGELL